MRSGGLSTTHRAQRCSLMSVRDMKRPALRPCSVAVGVAKAERWARRVARAEQPAARCVSMPRGGVRRSGRSVLGVEPKVEDFVRVLIYCQSLNDSWSPAPCPHRLV